MIFPSTLESFDIFLIIMAVTALIVFIALHFVGAGYGMMYTKKWGPTINNHIGWVLMESPVFFVMLWLWYSSDRVSEITPLVFLIIFEIHYFQRSFIFPMIMKGKGRMPVAIMLMGVIFNVLNAVMQGGWLFYFAPSDMYTISWLYTPQFILGTMIFFGGMYINLQSDYIIRHLRKPGDNKHYIPRGGMYNYVTSANYFGEIVEWLGFAILTWSLSGAVFAWWTFANLVPRSRTLHARYIAEFGDEYVELNKKKIIPFIY